HPTGECHQLAVRRRHGCAKAAERTRARGDCDDGTVDPCGPGVETDFVNIARHDLLDVNHAVAVARDRKMFAGCGTTHRYRLRFTGRAPGLLVDRYSQQVQSAAA